MNILAFDTSTSACSVALSCGDSILNEHVIQPRGHANLILPMIESLLNKAEITLSDINIISFGQGPGSFTGLRIAAGVCQGLAYSIEVPVIALSSLRILAQGMYRETQQENIAILQDARMFEIYWGCYFCKNGVMQQIGIENVSNPDIVHLDNNKNWYSAGEAWVAYQNKLKLGKNVVIHKDFIYPDAIDMITLAKYEFDNNNFIHAENICPVYIRNKVASTKK